MSCKEACHEQRCQMLTWPMPVNLSKQAEHTQGASCSYKNSFAQHVGSDTCPMCGGSCTILALPGEKPLLDVSRATARNSRAAKG